MRQAQLMSNLSIGIVIPTRDGARDLKTLLPILQDRDACNNVLIVDSESADGTAELARSFEHVRICTIRRKDFNHGATRELARREIGTDIVVFLTQDVRPRPGWLELLVQPIRDGRAVVAYSRQIPREGAGRFEAFPRQFNYPDHSTTRTIADVHACGVVTFFCSDSSAAYLNSALDEVGGFETLLTNEDYFAVARLLHSGGSIAYVAESEVVHSHRYTLVQEFQRYFDNGYVRGERRWIQQLVGNAEGRGASLVKAALVDLVRTQPWLVPYALLQAAAKWTGYRAGFHSTRAPLWWKRALSGQKYYWASPAAAIPPRPAPWHHAADWTCLPTQAAEANRNK